MLDEKALERALDARPYGLLSVRTMIEPNHDAAELLTAAITAYLAALPSGAEPVAPEGWVLVPRQATPEMLDAVRGYVRITPPAWVALLDAAPVAPQSSSQVTPELLRIAERAHAAQYEVARKLQAHVSEEKYRSTFGDEGPTTVAMRAALVAALSPVKGDEVAS